jgi:hypothetical protein
MVSCPPAEKSVKDSWFPKNPSAALRCNFVVAAYLYVRFTPQFLRALHFRGTLRVPDIRREASHPIVETLFPVPLREIIKILRK